jgi:dimeric dUTPase (all-alpha-NTP-PPase superfamily)
MSELNPENKCAKLWNVDEDTEEDMNDPSNDWLEQIFEMQWSLQKRVNSNPDDMTFQERTQFIMQNWNFLSCEYAEMLERLPFKTWKNYSPEQKEGFIDEEHKLEVWYEWCDMLHFFINMGLALGINGPDAFKLYYTKNRENFARQDRGY